jgi:hypothetical protein
MYDDCVICIIIALFCMCFVPKRAAEEMEREKRVRLQKLLLKQREDTGHSDEVLEVLVNQLSDIEADFSVFQTVWTRGPQGGKERNADGKWMVPHEEALKTRHGQILHASLCKALNVLPPLNSVSAACSQDMHVDATKLEIEVKSKDVEISGLRRELDLLRSAVRARTVAKGNASLLEPQTCVPAPPMARGAAQAPKTLFSHRTAAGIDTVVEPWLGSELDGISITENTTTLTCTEDDALSSCASAAPLGGAAGAEMDWDSVSVTGESVPQMRRQIEVLQKRVRDLEAMVERERGRVCEKEREGEQEMAEIRSRLHEKEDVLSRTLLHVRNLEETHRLRPQSSTDSFGKGTPSESAGMTGMSSRGRLSGRGSLRGSRRGCEDSVGSEGGAPVLVHEEEIRRLREDLMAKELGIKAAKENVLLVGTPNLS